MVVDQEDLLGLSLSLSFLENRRSLQLNLMPSAFSSSSPSPSPSPSPSEQFISQKTSWNDNSLDRNSETCRVENGAFLKGIDVNRMPSTAHGEDDAGVSSPNSTISSLSGKRSEREIHGDEHETERASSRGISDEEDGDGSRKQLRLSKDQSALLEESFKEHRTLNPKQKQALAKRLGLRPRQVEVWFQNRRARTKLKQTEVDCELLKRCYENLTEENQRLQKEVQELRALKLSTQFYMQMTPPTTLTMCPSCERVAVPPASAPAVPIHGRVHQAGTTTYHQPISINPWAAATTTPIPFMASTLHRNNLVNPRA